MSSEHIIVSVEDLAARVADGATLAVPRDISGVSMAATRALVRRGVRDLHLVCVPTSGMQADILIGAGCVASIETSGVTLGEFGLAPRFTAAVKAGSIALEDATCPAIHAGLQAAEKGIPFMPLRGILGSDLVGRRDDWRVIDNPFAEPVGDPPRRQLDQRRVDEGAAQAALGQPVPQQVDRRRRAQRRGQGNGRAVG